MSIEMVIPTRNQKLYQPNTYEPDREKSILDSDSDIPDLEESYESYESTSQFIQRSPQVIRHVVQFRAPEYEANISAGNKKFSKDAWRAVMKRREAKKEKAKDKTCTNGIKKNPLKPSLNLKTEATREISRERSGKFSRVFRKSLHSSGVSCNTCNTDSASVRSDSFTEGGTSRFISRLSPFSSRLILSRRSKSFDSIGSSSRRGNRKWRKWWKNKRERSPEKKPVFFKETPQNSPVDVSDFVEYSNIEIKEESTSNWLCASMEPVILWNDYFCAKKEEELARTECNKSSGILRNGTRNYVRFEGDHNKNHD